VALISLKGKIGKDLVGTYFPPDWGGRPHLRSEPVPPRKWKKEKEGGVNRAHWEVVKRGECHRKSCKKD